MPKGQKPYDPLKNVKGPGGRKLSAFERRSFKAMAKRDNSNVAASKRAALKKKVGK